MRMPVVTFLRITIGTKYDTDMKTPRYFVLKLNLNIVFRYRKATFLMVFMNIQTHAKDVTKAKRLFFFSNLT